MRIIKIVTTGLILAVPMAQAAVDPSRSDNQDAQIQTLVSAHYQQYKDQEYFSGVMLSTYIPNGLIKNYVAGRLTHDPDSKRISSETLFQIGSITKSFTAAILLQLEKEGRLELTDPLKKWLPEYNKWGTVTLTQLLNMTSGLPNYSDTPLLNTQIYYNLSRVWSNKELIGFVYPSGIFSPPLKSGFFYSNTNYILASLIIEKAAKDNYVHLLNERILRPLNLTDTFYVLVSPNAKMQARLAHGYNYNQYDNPAMVGRDTYEGNLSWAAAAGALTSNSQDIIKWVKALFAEEKILDAAQKNKLMNLVSTADGSALTQTDEQHLEGFGLGVAQHFDGKAGRVWFYEGETLGFRALYLYQPCNGVIISTIFNSATNHENDHAPLLLQKVYDTLLNQNPQLRCGESSSLRA